MVQVKAIGEVLERPVFLRIKFQKTGKLQYISHLDLLRTFHKMLVRSRMPLWFSEGFNPKPKMIFASSMSVGLESLCEFVDVRINQFVDTDSVVNALNDCSSKELRVFEAYYPESSFTDIAWARYEISITSDDSSNTAEKCLAALKASPLLVMKRTKSGDKESDISSYVGDVQALPADKGVAISVMLRAENTSFLNPEYLIGVLRRDVGILGGDLLQNTYSIVRTAMYDKDFLPFR